MGGTAPCCVHPCVSSSFWSVAGFIYHVLYMSVVQTAGCPLRTGDTLVTCRWHPGEVHVFVLCKQMRLASSLTALPFLSGDTCGRVTRHHRAREVRGSGMLPCHIQQRPPLPDKQQQILCCLESPGSPLRPASPGSEYSPSRSSEHHSECFFSSLPDPFRKVNLALLLQMQLDVLLSAYGLLPRTKT